ncbi:MAG: DUF4157 domain-containing protein [Bacteroidota bacterium]
MQYKKQNNSKTFFDPERSINSNKFAAKAKSITPFDNNINFTIQKKGDENNSQQEIESTSNPAQLKSYSAPNTGINFNIQKKANNTGLPDNLKSGIENLSGYSMDDIKVHYNSSKPTQLSAHAYAQGNQIHIAPGQQKHLAHEAWHVVQQKQGRVKPTKQLKSSVARNDDIILEKESDVIGSNLLKLKAESTRQKTLQSKSKKLTDNIANGVVQRKPGDYDKIMIAEGAEVTVKYKEGSKWLNKAGVVNAVKSTSLYVGDKRFTKTWIEEEDFEILGIPPGLAAINKETINKERPASPWTEEEDSAKLTDEEYSKKRELVEMLKEVVGLAETMPGRLKALMPHDRVFNLTPEAQLEYCVNISKGENAGVLAMALYTSYFYSPINKLLRGQLPEDFDYRIKALIIKTLNTLMKTLGDYSVTAEINTQRVELQAEWMGDPKENDLVRFPAFTSLHKESAGVEPMLQDIGNGTFGKVTKIAVLKISGRSPIIEPVKKYYDTENEIIIPPGMRTRVKNVKDIILDIPVLGQTVAKEYELEII